MTSDARQLWDREAQTFDEAADHGLLSPDVRQAWAELLLPHLGGSGRRVADLGCGTGSLSVLLAEAGHRVTGVDFSPEMISRAEQKASRHGVAVDFVVADASAPPLPPRSVDVVLSRHVLWAMPDPAAALAAWIDLLDAGGRLLLVEGRWSTGVGLTAAECSALVREATGRAPTVELLSDARYWGRRIDDERYLVVSDPDRG